ncbi:hypothetical protein A6E01_19635 (plasmid) [Vibrio breoganii]|uniref:Uncharacterized protein n=1 Tax=Vibrio breoganii TaxID=553239 RepID=A0AAN0XZ61_9VIBR|nr:hypothetical protein [Vibrio breoganii]ANO35427.1 hypothetical protein A6E01_19635 [Vibrio breoganii]PML19616.1 hypothetical protein BCT84_18245 [Vibrio breoganii]
MNEDFLLFVLVSGKYLTQKEDQSKVGTVLNFWGRNVGDAQFGIVVNNVGSGWAVLVMSDIANCFAAIADIVA